MHGPISCATAAPCPVSFGSMFHCVSPLNKERVKTSEASMKSIRLWRRSGLRWIYWLGKWKSNSLVMHESNEIIHRFSTAVKHHLRGELGIYYEDIYPFIHVLRAVSSLYSILVYIADDENSILKMLETKHRMTKMMDHPPPYSRFSL